MDAEKLNDSVQDEPISTSESTDNTEKDTVISTDITPQEADDAENSEHLDLKTQGEIPDVFIEHERVLLPEDLQVPEELLEDEGEDHTLQVEHETKPDRDYSQFDKEELLSALSKLIVEKSVESIKADVDSIKVNFYKKHKLDIEKLRKQHIENGHDEETFDVGDDEAEVRLKELLKKYKEHKADYIRKAEADKQLNLHAKQAIIEEIKKLTTGNESLNETFHQFSELQRQWRSIGLVPQKNLNDLWENYNHQVEKFYDFIKINKELRDLDLKKNLEIKINLCEKAEELLMEPSIVKAFRLLQEYHEKWRETGPVPNEMRTDIWNRFKEITSKINKTHQDYFEGLKEQQKKNFEAKTLLCEKVEEILKTDPKSMKDWDNQSKELIELQNVWRSIGYAPKKDNNKVYLRFRAACDEYFKKKRAYFNVIREDQNNNLQLKTDLCIQAEAYKDSAEWKKSTEDLINIQKKWKEIGPVPRKYSDALWKRFRTACDTFFNNKSAHFTNIDSKYDDNLKMKLALIEEIENYKALDVVEDNFNNLKEFQRRWAEIGFVPIKQKEDVQNNYRKAINRLFDTLKVDDSKRKLLTFKDKIKHMPQSRKNEFKINRERDKLIIKLKKLENDIMIWENNIGFFAKSKNAEIMIKDFQNKIDSAKDEIKVMDEKIKMIDNIDEE